jgi:hypothetical protein
LKGAARGEPCILQEERPSQPSFEKLVRAAFIRFLLLGGDEHAPVHELGVWLHGAFIQGSIRLQGCRGLHRLGLRNCWIDGDVNFRDAEIRFIYLRGCRTHALKADRVRVGGDVYLHDGFEAQDEVTLSGAEINGNLNASGGRFLKVGGTALKCDRANIRGDVILADGFSAVSEVDISGSSIGGQLNCKRGSFSKAEGVALDADDIKVKGAVLLARGFTSLGMVRFKAAEVGGDFGCDGGTFAVNKSQVHKFSEEEHAWYALDLRSARINGILWLGPAGPHYNQNATINGSLNLQDAFANVYVDNEASWPPPEIVTEHGSVRCVISLDGFTYDRFRGVAPIDAKIRKRWLLRQRHADITKNFRPQPFQQLIRVLREMGHDADARRIAMLKEMLLRPVRVQRAPPKYRPFVWLTGRVWGLACGYGYRPHRLIVSLMMLWLVCGAIYHLGANRGGFAPKDAQVWSNSSFERCTSNWTQCDQVGDIAAFNALAYSADVLIPIVDLNQRSAWTPMLRELRVEVSEWVTVTLPRWTLRGVAWVENILGTIGVILAGAILSGIVKRD